MSTATNDIVRLLEHVDVFEGVDQRHLKKLADVSHQMVHQPGEDVASEGTGGITFHVIVTGSAEVRLHGHDVRHLGPGDYFGEISLIDGEPRSATVTATETLTTIAVPRMAFKDILESDPVVARHLLVMLCARLREVDARV
jgi:CRP-like cAMP-binding protein